MKITGFTVLAVGLLGVQIGCGSDTAETDTQLAPPTEVGAGGSSSNAAEGGGASTEADEQDDAYDGASDTEDSTDAEDPSTSDEVSDPDATSDSGADGSSGDPNTDGDGDTATDPGNSSDSSSTFPWGEGKFPWGDGTLPGGGPGSDSSGPDLDPGWGPIDFGDLGSGSSSSESSESEPACTDSAGDTRGTAHSLSSRKSSQDEVILSGHNLADEEDVDVFKFHGEDDDHDVWIQAKVKGLTTFKLCQYVKCDTGVDNTLLACPWGSTEQVQIGNTPPACCAEYNNVNASDYHGFAIDELGFECKGGDESATVYIEVSTEQGVSCDDYTLSYSY